MTSRFACPIECPGQARRIVRSELGAIKIELLEIAELLVSELVTNALVHGSGDAALVVEVDKRRLHVEVLDSHSTVMLKPLRVDLSRAHGRGLAIVDALASSWGIEPRYVGKAVWFNLNL